VRRACSLALVLVFGLAPRAHAEAPSVTTLRKASPALKHQAFRSARTVSERTVLVRFVRALSRTEVAELEDASVTFRRERGSLVNVGRLYELRVTPAGLARLDEHPLVVDVDVAFPRDAVLPQRDNPLGRVPAIVGSDRLWNLVGDDGRPMRGEGIVLADLDTGIDVFHPLLFRADAGLYDWVDVDEDGVFTPFVDAVDLNADGTLDSDETLRQLGGNVYEQGNTLTDPVEGFDPARCWLYLDNGFVDLQRNVGPAFGYDDDTPGFGEPIFIADDVDQNGVLDVGEKLMRLGTSKVKSIYQLVTGATYYRGTNLSSYPDYEDRAHGTSVASILVGGVPGRSFVMGGAPDAELIMLDGVIPPEVPGDSVDYAGGQLAAMAFARDEGANVIIHEYGQRTGFFADGSSAHEELIDALSAEGVIQATATHNFANNGGDCFVTLGPGQSDEVRFEVFGGFGFAPFSIAATYRWPGATGTNVSATLIGPGMTEPVALSGTQIGADLYSLATVSVSARGTGMFDTSVFELDASGQQIGPLSMGEWRLTLTNNSNSTISGPLRITDETAYSTGVQITSHTLTDAGSMAWPSTADSAISVGASVGNVPTMQAGESDNGLRYFSGRGPRIDDVLAIDIVAPSDHYAAEPFGEVPAGSYARFGGTSGALPQVGAAIGLLLQQRPDLEAEEVRFRIQDSAGTTFTGGAVPNRNWGHGRLDTYRLLMGEDRPDNTAPRLGLSAPGAVGVGRPFTFDVSGTDDDEDPLESLRFRVDADYDGTWDAEAMGAMPEMVFDTTGPVAMVIEVMDPFGAASADVVMLEVAELPFVPDPMAGCGCSADGQPQSAVLIGLLAACGLLWRRRRR
jgi:MYXO-CTERM domain-containing protein